MTDSSAAPPGVVPPGGVLGVLGGGQLGRMMAIAAARLGLRTWIHAETADSPAADVAWRSSAGGPTFEQGLDAFAQGCDVVTFESENTPLAAVDRLAKTVGVAPSRRALEVSQDRLFEKSFLREIGARTTAFAPVDGPESLAAHVGAMGGVGLLKTRRLGYDGKGQAWVRSASPEAAAAAWSEIGGADAILEAPVAFQREISIIAARGTSGAMSAYDPAVNVHESGVLRTSRVDGAIDAATAADARRIAFNLLESLEYVGVVGVEFFELDGGELLVNEFAPRVHNSGHWTLEACPTDQFEQHVRAICGWPLGDVRRHSDVEMRNLIGEDVADWRRLADRLDMRLHLYGKQTIRPGRKMGHETRIIGSARPTTEGDA